MKTSRLAILLLFALLASSGCNRGTTPGPGSGQAAPKRFTAVRVNPQTERIELFLRDDKGQPFKRFDSLQSWLAGQNKQLRFGMNAGMFHPDLSAVGLLVQDGKQISPLNLSDGGGNFFMKPNGVFSINESGPRIVDSTEYPGNAKGVRLATQSGPLLLRNGVLHPAIHADSTSRLVRNGVGVSGDFVLFVISDEPVNFYEMATYFRDELKCTDALYLDGVVSSLYSIDLKRNDSTVDLGPMVGVVR